MHQRRRVVSLIAASPLVGLAGITPTLAASASITLLHSNDVYQIAPVKGQGGFAPFMTLLRAERARNANTITSFGGDLLSTCRLRLSSPEPPFFEFLAGVAAGPLAAAELPLQMPSYHDDKGNELVPSLGLEGAFFPQSQSWFGKSKDNLGETSNYWFEQVGKLALTGQAALDG